MRRAYILVAAILLLAGQPLYGQLSSPRLGSGGAGIGGGIAAAQADDWETIILPLRYTPANQLAKLLGTVFSGQDGIRISVDEPSNLLVARVRPKQKQELLNVIRELDRRPVIADIQAILLQATIPLDDPESLSGPLVDVAHTIKKLQAGGDVFVARHFTLTAIENQKAMLQVGQSKTVVTGTVQRAGFGGVTRSVRERQVGTLLVATMRATDQQRLMIDVQFELSDLVENETGAAKSGGDLGGGDLGGGDLGGGGEEGTSPNMASLPPSVLTLTFQSTLELRSGSAKLVQQSVRRSNSGSERGFYLILAATIRDGGPGPISARALSRSGPPPRQPQRAGSRALRSPRSGVDTPVPRQAGSTQPSRRPSGGRGVERTSLAEYTMRRYDKDGSGALEKSEWSGIRRSPGEADSDKNDVVSIEELKAWLNKRFKRPSSDARRQGQSATGPKSATGQPSDGKSDEPASVGSDKPAADPIDNASVKSDKKPAGPPDARYLAYATGLFKRYDADGDGKLSAQERAKMNVPPEKADADGDGFVTPEELARFYEKR